jgi:hypothetical protein
MKVKPIYIGCLALAVASIAATRIEAHGVRAGVVQADAPKPDADPIAGINKRLGQLKMQLKELRVKPHALAPGATVELNPQPEPPGTTRSKKMNSKGDEVSLNPQPEPPGSAPDILRKMRSTLASVRADFDKLSLNSEASAKFTAKLNEARLALGRYEKAGDQKAANVALDNFSHALEAVAKLSESYVK